MANFFKKMIDVIAGWLFSPACNGQCDSCCVDEDQEKQEKEPEQKTGGFAY